MQKSMVDIHQPTHAAELDAACKGAWQLRMHVCTCTHIHSYTHTVGVKKSSRSIRNTGTVYQKTGGERGMNGNGTGNELTTVLYIRIPFHFNFPVPGLSAQARLRVVHNTTQGLRYVRCVAYVIF